MGSGVGRASSREVEALLTLTFLPGVGDRTVTELTARFGTARGALDAPGPPFREVAGEEASRARRDPELRSRARRVLQKCRKGGIEVVSLASPAYPSELQTLHDPPPLLFLRGRRSLLGAPAVTVVGSRKATGYGRRTARRIGGALARCGIPVLSGMALGIDGAAHRGAVEAGGVTLAVLGSGVDVASPTSNRDLFHHMGRDGLLISEFLPGSPARPHHFPRRNRLLAALAGAVVVVEAARRSGALITVDHALDLGREIFAVPGPVDRATSRGTNALIRDGARPLVDLDHFVEELEGLGLVGKGGSPELPGGGSAVFPTLGEDASALWRVLEDGPRGVEELSGAAGISPERTLAALTALEVEGWVVRTPGMQFHREEEAAGAGSS